MEWHSSINFMFFICKKPNCDALGSPRKMTNESGTVVWTGAYQPFGEMLAGTGNVHGFTGKELDAETGLNYFCQRYYDSQVGRFMTLDTWTHLPDDVRLFSHSKYLSWDNYRIEYNPRSIKINMKEILHCKTRLSSYDTLTNEINALSRTSQVVSFNSLLTNSILFLDRRPIYAQSLLYSYQLNSYLYCNDNPLRFIDTTGNAWSEKDWYVNVLSGLFGTAAGILVGTVNPWAGAAVGFLTGISTARLLDWYWDYCMDWSRLPEEGVSGHPR